MNMDKKIYVTRSSMPSYEEYITAIKPLWESHRITNMGDYHKQLEKELREYMNVSELSLVVNGHMAIELMLQEMKFPEGAEVITTPFTFISTTHAIIRNHLTPVFCDVKIEDGTIDENKIESLITEKTVAILPVHVYGHICNIEKIEQIAYKYGLKVIYDASHAFGEKYKGVGIGNYGYASTFSFHATKVFNTIEGGAVAFHNPEVYDQLYNLKNFGIRGEEVVAEVGANAKMNEFCAIMGLCNLKHIDGEIKKRKERYEYYISLLKDIQGITLFEQQKDVIYNYAYLPILVNEKKHENYRDKLYIGLKEQNIYTRKYFYPITADQACFKNKFKNCDLENARELSRKVLILPLYADLDFGVIQNICELIKGIL